MTRARFARLLPSLLPSLVLSLSLPAAAQTVCAQPAATGNVSGLGGVVNTYFPGPVTDTTLSAGTTAVTFGTVRRGAAQTVAAGDLLLLMQMQGADIDATNTDSYGDGVAGGAGSGQLSSNLFAGRYEFVTVTAVTGAGSVTVRGQGAGGGLVNTYVNRAATATQGQARYQVIRVPQYGNLTLGAAPVTAEAWDGTDGGVVVLDVAGTLNWNGGSVNVNALGFRGGAGQGLGGVGAATGYTNLDYRNVTAGATHGNKGEGLAGTPRFVLDPVTSTLIDTGAEGYPNGSRARGAPGNAGGGGTDGAVNVNSQNSGGGGGANGGGGGQGGNSWSSNLAIGGFGGKAAPASLGALFMGGGGGSGSRNNGSGVQGSGGAGGGIVIIRAGQSTGTGTITASGQTGTATLNDGAGGGGAGGTVIVMTGSGTLSGVSITASGGNGGNAWPAQAAGANNVNAHGPGGGGGGGIVYTNVSGASITAAPGGNGTSTSGAVAFGAQPGVTGTIPGGSLTGLPGIREGAACPVLSVSKSTSTPTVWRGAKATYTLTVTNAGGASSSVRVQDTLPAGFTLSGTPTVTPTSARVAAADASTATALDLKTFRLAYGESLTVTFEALTPTDPALRGTVYQNSASASTTDAAGNAVTGTYLGSSSAAEDVRLLFPSLKVTKAVRNVTQDEKKTPAVRNFGTSGGGYPGDRLEYCLTYLNDGDGPLNGVSLTDSIPANTAVLTDAYGAGLGVQFTPASGAAETYTSAADTDAGQLSQAGGLSVALGTVAQGASGTACFQVSVR
ncbi:MULTISPECIES: DUF11 domain-containing protein [unclassified Deinococcus]|uniref:DUF11 domain-containing protein n=1 Tax=unclassified Deinococcus TaxID=2623546 RepID=UPI001C302232|nr:MULTISPECIES: DUF11 domain-containing protein [unclassified Deinococcus]MDK2013325.1 DUF11 domain-containing protein [Deinococcus sp. 43]